MIFSLLLPDIKLSEIQRNIKQEKEKGRRVIRDSQLNVYLKEKEGCL